MRKRGKFWNAQVKIAGWRSFTKSFAQKSDAVAEINEFENKIRSATFPNVIMNTKFTLEELLQKYSEEASPTFKGYVLETCRLKSIARKPIVELDVWRPTKQHFILNRDDRLKDDKGRSLGSEHSLMKRVLDFVF